MRKRTSTFWPAEPGAVGLHCSRDGGGGRRRQRPRGFTLMEMLISLAVGSVVLALALQSVIYMTGSVSQMDQSALAGDEARSLQEYLASSLMAVGGGLVRPWSALQVENGVLNGTDRITAALAAGSRLQCPIRSLAGGLLQVDDTGGCCLTADFALRQVLLISGESDGRAHWESRFVRSVDLGRCQANLLAGQAAVLNVSPSGPAAWIEGTIAVVAVRVLWLDTRSDRLMVDEDFDLDGVIDSRVVADHVIDLQAALGYDVAPWDWRVTDTDGIDDEWLYNATGDTFGVADGQGLASASVDELRMVRFGVAVGAPVKAYRGVATEQLLDGPVNTREGWVIRAGMGVTGLRNYDIMR